MKYMIYTMFFCCVCFADWDNVDKSVLDTIKQNTTSINFHLNQMSSSQLETIKYNQRELKDVLDNMYLGYDAKYGGGLDTSSNHLGNYRDIYNTIENFNNNGFQLWDDTNFFNSYIKTFSNNNYEAIMSQTNQTAVPFIGKAQYFNYSDKMKIKLESDGVRADDSWFEVDVFNGQTNSVKRLKTSVQNRLAEVQELPENLPNQIADPNILFSFNLNSVFDLFVRLGLWTTNPVQDLIVPVKIIPSNEHDYLYNFYTWWTSDAFYPRMFHNCLKALICLSAFIYCYNYVVSTWNA